MNAAGPPFERVLVPIDGSDGSQAAVAEVLRRSRGTTPTEVHLLNVQPLSIAAEILAHLPAQAGDAYYARLGGEALAKAQSTLEEAGIRCTSHRMAGPVVESILAQCDRLQCDSIVMGTHGHGPLAGAFLGSVATGVVHGAAVPVTLVRATDRRFPGA